MGIFSFFQTLFSHAPSYSDFLKLGYKARTYNGDFIFTRHYSDSSIHLHQSVEPHNQKLAQFIDFEIEDACIIIKSHHDRHLNRARLDHVRELFDFVYERGPYLFCMNRHMDFNDAKVVEIVKKLDELFD